MTSGLVEPFLGIETTLVARTIMVKTLVFTIPNFLAYRRNLKDMLRDHAMWGWPEFEENQKLKLRDYTVSSALPPKDAWLVADHWADNEVGSKELLAFPDKPRSEDAILDFVGWAE